MSSFGQSPNPDQTYKLDPEAGQALGNKVGPEAVWLQVRTAVQKAADEQFEAAQAEMDKAIPDLSLASLLEILPAMNPVRGVNLLHESNPNLNLQTLEKTDPLKVLKAVLRVMTKNDRYQTLKK